MANLILVNEFNSILLVDKGTGEILVKGAIEVNDYLMKLDDDNVPFTLSLE